MTKNNEQSHTVNGEEEKKKLKWIEIKIKKNFKVIWKQIFLLNSLFGIIIEEYVKSWVYTKLFKEKFLSIYKNRQKLKIETEF